MKPPMHYILWGCIHHAHYFNLHHLNLKISLKTFQSILELKIKCPIASGASTPRPPASEIPAIPGVSPSPLHLLPPLGNPRSALGALHQYSLEQKQNS